MEREKPGALKDPPENTVRETLEAMGEGRLTGARDERGDDRHQEVRE